MFEIRYAKAEDRAFWFALDRHLEAGLFEKKLSRDECYILEWDGKKAGVLRYGLLWDNTPFLNLLYIKEERRGLGVGRQALASWEREMRCRGYGAVMTSTRSDEGAQHFYRKLGYRDCGCLILGAPPLEQPAELFFAKYLNGKHGSGKGGKTDTPAGRAERRKDDTDGI